MLIDVSKGSIIVYLEGKENQVRIYREVKTGKNTTAYSWTTVEYKAECPTMTVDEEGTGDDDSE